MARRQLKGSVVVVTGASSGVGRAIARAFGAAGAKVGLIARNREALEDAAEEIRRSAGSQFDPTVVQAFEELGPATWQALATEI